MQPLFESDILLLFPHAKIKRASLLQVDTLVLKSLVRLEDALAAASKSKPMNILLTDLSGASATAETLRTKRCNRNTKIH
jgi:hypothetical protein